jgi:hypothetical protein
MYYYHIIYQFLINFFIYSTIMKKSNENSQSTQLTQQIKVVNTVLEDVSIWSGEQNISISIDTGVPFQNTHNYRYFIK